MQPGAVSEWKKKLGCLAQAIQGEETLWIGLKGFSEQAPKALGLAIPTIEEKAWKKTPLKNWGVSLGCICFLGGVLSLLVWARYALGFSSLCHEA